MLNVVSVLRFVLLNGIVYSLLLIMIFYRNKNGKNKRSTSLNVLSDDLVEVNNSFGMLNHLEINLANRENEMVNDLMTNIRN